MMEYFNRETVLIGGFFIGVLILAWIMVRAQYKDKNLRVVDILTGDTGRYASNKLFAGWTFYITSCAFMFFVFTGKADATLILGFAGVWGGLALGNKAVTQAKQDTKED